MPSKPRLPRDVLLVASARGASLLGDEIAYVALIWRLKSHGSWPVAALTLSLFLPMIMLAPWAGMIADRYSAKRVAVTAALVQALAAIGLAVLHDAVSAIVGVLLLASGTTFINPAISALLPRLVERPMLPRAMGLSQILNSVAVIIGPAIGGSLVAVTGQTVVPLLIDAVSFAAYAVLISRLSQDRVPEGTGSSDTATARGARREGVRFIARDQVIATFLAVLVACTFGLAVLNVCEVFFITESLHGTAASYGILGLSFGVGNLAGALLMRRLKVEPARYALGSVLSGVWLSVSALLLSFSPNVAAAAVACVLIGVGNSSINMMVGLLMAVRVPDEVRGRFSAAFSSFTTGSQVLAMLSAGALLNLMSPRSLLQFGTALAVAVSLIGIPLVVRASRRDQVELTEMPA